MSPADTQTVEMTPQSSVRSMGFAGESLLCGVSCFAGRPLGSQRHFDVTVSRFGSRDGNSMLDYSERVRTLRQRQLVHVDPQPSTDFSALRVRAHHIPRGPLPKLVSRGHEGRFVGACDAEPRVKDTDSPRRVQKKTIVSDTDDTDTDTSSFVGTRISALQRRRSTKLTALSEQPSALSIAGQLFSDEPDVETSGDVVCPINMAEVKDRNKCHTCTFIPVLQGTRVTPPSHEKNDVDTNTDSGAPNTSFVHARQIAELNRKLREEAATRLLRAAVENLQRLENRPRDTLRIIATLRAQRRLIERRRTSKLEAIPEVDHTSTVAEKTLGDHRARPSVKLLSQSIDERVSVVDDTADDIDSSAYNAFGSRGSVSESKKGKSRPSYSYDQSSRTSSQFSFGRSRQEVAHFGSSGMFKTNRLQMHANRKFKQRNVKYKN